MVPAMMEKENSMRFVQWLGLSLIAASFLLCGCGGNNNTVQPPAALSYISATADYTKGVAIAANNPFSAGGAVTSYSISPALPAGLSLSAGTGVISGTPTAVTAKTSYTVTASNSAGSTTGTLTITVNDQPPSRLSYATGSAVYVVRTPISPDSPSSSGGAVTSYGVTPALPAGLNLNTSTGTISGTPMTVAATTSYTVTASNSGGTSAAFLHITVAAVPPLSAANVNLIFVVSEDLAYNVPEDVNTSTANFSNQGLQRSLLMGSFLKNNVLGMNNVTHIYALEPMSHLQTTITGDHPDMVALETVQQFAMLNQITVSSDTANSYPIFTSYSPSPESPQPPGVAPPVLPCAACQGLDFKDQDGDNETLVSGIANAKVSGFYVFSAPWETTQSMLAGINSNEGYNLTLPSGYEGPDSIYAISIPPSGTASLVTFNSNLNPPSTYPKLAVAIDTPCRAQTGFSYIVTGGIGGAVIPKGQNTNETVYLIRHAEAHPTPSFEDGNYVGAGQWRALALPTALRGKIHPTQVSSVDPAVGIPAGASIPNSSYIRPSLTVEPYAIANNLPYDLAASFPFLKQNAPTLCTNTSNYFFTGGTFSNQTLLVAWEHEHIPPTVNALFASYFPPKGIGGPTAPDWPSADYDTIWTVRLDSVGNLTVDNSMCEGIDSGALPAAAPQF